MSAQRIAFKAEQQAWREQRRASLVAPEGWSSLVGLHWLEPGPHFMGSSAGNGIRLALGPSHLGMIELKGERIRFVPERGVAVMVDGVPVRGSTRLRADRDPDGPSRLTFDDGKGVLTVIQRRDRHAVRVRHADAPSRLRFAGLAYWPAESDWVIPGRFTAHPPGRMIEIANIVGGTDPMPNPGAVEFDRDGQTYRLEAIADPAGLFLVFADRTNGHGSYGAGRFLDTAGPDATGHVALDFNRAYNPPCAFTPFATCPLPPPENRLDLAVTAGEKAYNPPRN